MLSYGEVSVDKYKKRTTNSTITFPKARTMMFKHFISPKKISDDVPIQYASNAPTDLKKVTEASLKSTKHGTFGTGCRFNYQKSKLEKIRLRLTLASSL